MSFEWFPKLQLLLVIFCNKANCSMSLFFFFFLIFGFNSRVGFHAGMLIEDAKKLLWGLPLTNHWGRTGGAIVRVLYDRQWLHFCPIIWKKTSVVSLQSLHKIHTCKKKKGRDISDVPSCCFRRKVRAKD